MVRHQGVFFFLFAVAIGSISISCARNLKRPHETQGSIKVEKPIEKPSGNSAVESGVDPKNNLKSSELASEKYKEFHETAVSNGVINRTKTNNVHTQDSINQQDSQIAEVWKKVIGIYKHTHTIQVWNGKVWDKERRTDCFEIRRDGDSEMSFTIDFWFDNLHGCNMSGVVSQLEKNKLILSSSEPEMDCRIVLSVKKNRLVFDEERPPMCTKEFCGARGFIIGQSLSFKTRLPSSSDDRCDVSD